MPRLKTPRTKLMACLYAMSEKELTILSRRTGVSIEYLRLMGAAFRVNPRLRLAMLVVGTIKELRAANRKIPVLTIADLDAAMEKRVNGY